MIKISFKYPYKFIDEYGDYFISTFLIGRYIKYPFGKMIFYGDNSYHIGDLEIKSIEHVKPTDL